jgi:predicted ATPase
VGGPRDQTPRQQTLRATIDWSYHLLVLEQQAVFRRLDRILRGRWLSVAERAIGEPAAAEAIAGGRACGPEQGKALALENRP